jgi:hypothetical protein
MYTHGRAPNSSRAPAASPRFVPAAHRQEDAVSEGGAAASPDRGHRLEHIPVSSPVIQRAPTKRSRRIVDSDDELPKPVAKKPASTEASSDDEKEPGSGIAESDDDEEMLSSTDTKSSSKGKEADTSNEEEEASSEDFGTLSASESDSSGSSDAEFKSRSQRYLHTLDNGVRIITEKFNHKGTDRQRPVEYRIPLSTLRKNRQGDAPPRPLSLLTPKGETFAIDSDFDPEGKYQRGHMQPSSSAAPGHSGLTVPMEQHTNQHGAWRQSEASLDRMLLKTQGQKDLAPKKGRESAVAAILAADKKSPGFLRTKVRYRGTEDERVPRSFKVSLHHDKKRLLTRRIQNKFIPSSPPAQPSSGLEKLFDAAHKELEARDAKAHDEWKAKPDDYVMERKEWDPVSWERGPEGKLHPPRSIPEAGLPRPHRALDVLAEMAGDESSLKELHPVEEEMLKAVAGQQPGEGPFDEHHRSLAELHSRYLNRGKLLSDLRPDQLEALKLNPTQRSYYEDPAKDKELAAGGGNARPEADHHVPQDRRGTNHFTNLLWVSRGQNARKEAKTKPEELTNPHSIKKPGLLKMAEPSTNKPPKSHKASTVYKRAKGPPKEIDEATWKELREELDHLKLSSEDLVEKARDIRDNEGGQLPWKVREEAKKNSRHFF